MTRKVFCFRSKSILILHNTFQVNVFCLRNQSILLPEYIQFYVAELKSIPVCFRNNLFWFRDNSILLPESFILIPEYIYFDSGSNPFWFRNHHILLLQWNNADSNSSSGINPLCFRKQSSLLPEYIRFASGITYFDSGISSFLLPEWFLASRILSRESTARPDRIWILIPVCFWDFDSGMILLPE